MVDMGTGLYAAISVLMALQERHRSGLGQFIDMSLYDCAVSLMHPHVPKYYLSGKTPELTGNHHPNICPYDRFHTKTVDIFVGAGNDRAFQRLCSVLDANELPDDERFSTGAKRNENRSALTDILSEFMANVDGEDFCKRLMEAGVPAGPVLDTAQVMNANHTKHRNMAAVCDWWQGTGTPIKFTRTPGAIKTPPPQFGVDGRDVLTEHGISQEEIEALVKDGVLVEKRR